MRKMVFTAALALVCQAAFSQLDASATSGLDRGALDAFLHRVVRDRAGAFVVEYLAPVGGKDVFEVYGRADRKIVLRGSNGVSVASALNYYLRHYCHVLVSWNTSSSPLSLPAKLPVVTGRVRRQTPYSYRYYLNYCTFNYSMAWWDWARWQREIDWMAMNGINMPLALTGEEAIWQEVYREMGFTDGELDAFFTGPAYFSWLWMGNIDAWGGPLPGHWKESHRLLQKKILAAERAFGMKPVLPAFTGHVPPAFVRRFPGAKVKRTNWDAGFPDVYILDPADPLFVEIGRRFLAVQTREFGTDHFYSADTFNENVPPTSDSAYLDAMSKKVYASMAAADPAAVWVMQGWMFHYNAAYWKPVQIQALLKAVPDDRMILLDLYSESHPVWNRTDAYYGKPWIWNMLHNFGGNNALWGRMSHAAEDPSAALHDPASGRMVGIGLTPEGIEQNPALYHLMLENVWGDGVIDVPSWLREYAAERYGDCGGEGLAANGRVWADVDSAWALLERSVYRGGLGEGGPESIFQARPTFEKKIDRVLTGLDYDPAVLVRAVGLFGRAAPVLGKSEGYRYDLVDMTRQMLANYANPLQQEWVEAWKRGDTAGYRRHSREFLSLMDDMDRLLATRPEFLLGRWIRAARDCGVTVAERGLYEKNARDLITLWGDKESGLREYSNRQWSGLIRGFYKHRWEMLFAQLDKGKIDWAVFEKEVKDWEWSWVNGHESYSSEAKGDAVAVALELYRKYKVLAGGGAASVGDGAASSAGGSNDHIFPAAAVAKPYIDFDGKGFLVKGKRTFLVSAGMEYARVPHELWRDRLQWLQRAGFNCIETYTFWNFHEPEEGKFDFSGDHDLEAFLRLVGEMGMYAIVRVGPYYCAEWDNGGYPLWLRFKPGVRVREDNPEFLGCVDRFFDRLLPIVCRQQVRFGGPVILVQLENEHNLGWGTAMPDGYFRHLREKALSKGLEVPYFFSGLHHSSDPAGDGRVAAGLGDARLASDAASLDDPGRPNPWFSTEFWSVWYNGYGSGARDSAVYARRTWKIIAHGGGGYNYYMAHGGSNFGFTNNDEDAASYDYGAAVGQAGDLRPVYFAFKRAAWFARSFEAVLADAVDGTARWKRFVRDTAVRVTARHALLGDLVFLDNPGSTTVRTEVRGAPVVLAPGEIFPVVHHFILGPSMILEWAPVRVMGIVGAELTGGGVIKTMVVEGEEGSEARLEFIIAGKPRELRARFAAAPQEFFLRAGGEVLRVLAVDRRMADRTWIVDKGNIVCGEGYIGEVRMREGVVSVVAEVRGMAADSIWVFGPGGKGRVLRAETRRGLPVAADSVAALSVWRVHSAAGEARPDFHDRDRCWLASERPLQMGADGDRTADAWYRARVRIDTGGEYTLQARGGDRVSVFVDGKFAAAGSLHEGNFPLSLDAGDHLLALFAAHDGRDKLAGFMGSMDAADPKGLYGDVRLERGATVPYRLAGWRFLRAMGPLEDTVKVLPMTGVGSLAGTGEGWRDYRIGDDAFGGKEGFGWFRVELPEPPMGAVHGVLDFRSTDENAVVFLNRRRLLRHEGWNLPFAVNIGGLDTMARPLVLTVFIENYSNEGGIDRPVEVHYFSGSREITGWSMRGGVSDPDSIEDWKGLAGIGGSGPASGAASGGSGVLGGPGAAGAPCFYRSEFRVGRYADRGEHPIWRVHVDGLGHGSVWVNGHHLGRYPEKTPAPGLYIPECWLRDGANELVVFDEDGRRPDSVSVRQERDAGRSLVVYSAGKRAVDYVDPMIGTGRSDVVTKWGNEGGAYPGAVAPWGFVQMTPETKTGGGYDYGDGAIGWFSCFGHLSGYPGGSAGRGRIMPVAGSGVPASLVGSGVPASLVGSGVPAPREFLHADEIARPGYYGVLFRDNGTLVEVTASERVGWMRCTFPRGVVPRLWVAGLDGIGALHFSDRVIGDERVGDGRILTFASDMDRATVVEIAIGISGVSVASAEQNYRAGGLRFDEVERQTREKWLQALSVIDVPQEGRGEDKTIFYTALYHSLLLPWIISDADGRYRGSDGLVHRTAGMAEYGGFSPWDSFRSQQPLLTLLFPQRERDILASMMDVYRQTGALPAEPMTGNHSIPMVADAWLKGVRATGAAETYAALCKGVLDAPYRPEDRAAYGRLGYLPLSYPESVTRTVEYAYDDWALAVFAKRVMHRDVEADRLFQRSHSFRNLLDPGSLFLLPREGDKFLARPGTSGYKEGDAWVYTYFAPQWPEELIRLLGGDREFVRRLDGALTKGDIVFDNETVFHVPYLFALAGAPGKTREWIRAFRDGRFSAGPGGLPGNDDLGAFSSWYVFSAMGFFPMCPGRPEYVIGTPLFERMRVKLDGGRTLVIRGEEVEGVRMNGRMVKGSVLMDSLVRAGGELVLGVPGGTGKPDRFVFSDAGVSKARVEPHELFRIHFTVKNPGELGTAVVVLDVDGKEYARKNCLVPAGGVVVDSMDCRLYPLGKHLLTIGGVSMEVEVAGAGVGQAEISELELKHLLWRGQLQTLSYSVRNIGGVAREYPVAVIDGRLIRTDTLLLQPGEKKRVTVDWVPSGAGVRTVEVGTDRSVFKVFDEAIGSLLLSLSLSDSLLVDRSGLGNSVSRVGVSGDSFVEVANSPSLDEMGETLTMAAWVYPSEKGEGLVDIFTKGDHHVLQVKNNQQLSFFAGGWGRGDCTVDLPADWFGHWHHIAGVCTGDGLKLYIDGKLKGSTKLDERVNLSGTNRWVLGRNEEFPGQRRFKGLLDKVQVWAEPLSGAAISALAAAR
ncbi:MAG TPA: GH92 family glycosyl hydrolase [Puia sp.]|uniref:GH92 family glycosyl hydrolase n=1 Tax=Puia sp. TaxID=2045100 RepID=UPI002BAEBBD5|nr:GH92 family glycosyl hydrolase [Puia sp.]HVU95787.1 GH92 family glycosyl hydrolase [Puia sp.]